MITNNIIQRVFHMKNRNTTGTCFVIDHDKKQYFITAKHLLDNFQNIGVIQLFFNNSWSEIPINIIGHDTLVDVSVFTLNQHFNRHPINLSSEGIVYGQDTFFLGFPYNIKNPNAGKVNFNFPLPLVKKATLSCMMNDINGRYFYLDGINNPGFSGGPVVFYKNNSKDMNVAAVISGYKKAEETPLDLNINSGIIIAYDIKYAIDLINNNPQGVTIP